MSFHHTCFEQVFARIFVYNILFEDSDVDCRYLHLDRSDRVLSISGAGCGVAALLSFQPASIDVVDINRAHLSLAVIKMLAPRYLGYTDFYQLLGYGKTERAREFLDLILRDQQIPDVIRRYWHTHAHIFTRRGLYRSGLTAFMTHALARLCGIHRQWVDEMVRLPVAERIAMVERDICQVLRRPILRAMLASPVQLLSQGVNFRQKQKIEREFQMSLADYIPLFLKKQAQTDTFRNWFGWNMLLGEFNHCDPLAVPPYLRLEFYEKSACSTTAIRFHHTNLHDILTRQHEPSWTYINCSDALDWMNPATQRQMLDLIYQQAAPGATVLIRTVENRDLIAQHGLQQRFHCSEDLSANASAEDRSCLYALVNFYTVNK